MKTKNKYSYPIDKKFIKRISKDSPSHRKYKGKYGKYDETQAIDFISDKGTPIKVALDGEVVYLIDNLKKNYSKWDPPSENIMREDEQDGNNVVIKHKNNEFSIYSHMEYKKVFVKKGQKVKAGTIIGHVGDTGWSFGPHLHFMVFRFTKPKPAKDFESLEVQWK